MRVIGNTSERRGVVQLASEAERNARVLVVDDDRATLSLVTQILTHAGFTNVVGVFEAEKILPTVVDFEPDVVLLDLHMPGADGLDVLAGIGEAVGRRNYLPVLVITGDSSRQARDAALAAGARDFLTKPYDRTEIVLRVRNLVETRMLYVELQKQNVWLTERFIARTEELEDAEIEILDRLARASDLRDDCTQAHTYRVGQLSGRIGERMGMRAQDVEHLRIAARLHDIGKIGVSDAILLKEGPLTPAEFLAQEQHTIIGANILSGSRFPVLRLAEEIALTHHEAWDGSGYPRGISGEAIPLAARIVAVADVFDALTHVRPYKKAWTRMAAVLEIQEQSGAKFDPGVVEAFVSVVAELPDRDVEAELDLPVSDVHSDRARLIRNAVRLGAAG